MKIVIADYPELLMPTHDLEKARLLKGLGEDTEIVVYEYADARREEFLNLMADADALLAGFIPIDDAAMARMPKLKIISINATGYNVVDLEAANRRRIAVCPVGEYCTIDVAEHTIAMMLSLVKNLKAYSNAIDRRHFWDYQVVAPNQRIKDMTLGIFGLGKIGTSVAMRARALGMRVIAYDKYVNHIYAERFYVHLTDDPGEIFEQADVICNHMMQTEENRDFFNMAAFRRMKKRPYLINAGRGAAVVEEDLLAARDAGLLRGAGLDVLRDEHPDALARNPLVDRDNVIITPHSAFYSTSALEDLQIISSDNIVHYLLGAPEKVFKLVTTFDV